jgi:hypothetical protein
MQTSNPSIGKMRRITGNAVMILGGLMLIGSAAVKFAHVPAVVTQLGAMGFDGNRLMFIAALEVTSAVLFLTPLTRSGGLLLVSSYMGGAIATHLQHGEPILQPSLFLFLLWFGAWLRHPEILWSLSYSAPSANQLAQQGHQETALRQI